jgi:hypothetical protein
MRYTTQVCVLVCISKLPWTNGRLGGGRKHQYGCGWRDWKKLPMIIWVCKGIGECVGWSTTFILTSKELELDQTRYTTKTRDHESMDSKMIRLISRVCAFYEERHVIMDCPFVRFHIKAGIARHVEL